MNIPMRDSDLTASREEYQSPEMISVHCAPVPTSLPAIVVTRWIASLPKRRKMTLARRLSGGNGLQSLTGLALLASLSTERQLPSLGQLQWTSNGKPSFPDGPDFSITHSAGFAACAVATKGLRVGIDLESIDRVRMATIRLVANDDERNALESGSRSPAELWTAKEAVLKLTGARLADIGRVSVDRDRANFAGVEFHVQCCRLKEGLLLAIATEQPIPQPSIGWRSPSEIFGMATDCN